MLLDYASWHQCIYACQSSSTRLHSVCTSSAAQSVRSKQRLQKNIVFPIFNNRCVCVWALATPRHIHVIRKICALLFVYLIVSHRRTRYVIVGERERERIECDLIFHHPFSVASAYSFHTVLDVTQVTGTFYIKIGIDWVIRRMQYIQQQSLFKPSSNCLMHTLIHSGICL